MTSAAEWLYNQNPSAMRDSNPIAEAVPGITDGGDPWESGDFPDAHLRPFTDAEKEFYAAGGEYND